MLENVLGGDILGTGDKGVGARFSLINDPRNPYNRLLTVERLGNVVGGRGIRYVNVDMDVSYSTPIFICQTNKIKDHEGCLYRHDQSATPRLLRMRRWEVFRNPKRCHGRQLIRLRTRIQRQFGNE